MEFATIKDVLFAAARRAGLTEFDVYCRIGNSLSLDAMKKEQNSFSASTAAGVSFRCAAGGHIGSASTESLTKEDLEDLVPRAVAASRVIDSDETPIFYDKKDEYVSLQKEAGDLPDVADLRRVALAMQEELFAQSALATDASTTGASVSRVTVALANSNGITLSHTAENRCISAEAVVKKDDEAASAFAFSPSFKEGKTVVGKAIREATERLGAKGLPTGVYDVIFSPREMRTLLSAFSPIFSGKNALMGLSRLAGKEGMTIASECFTLFDDPFYPENTMKMPFDAEGVATRTKPLIEKGVLKTLLYDLATAKKAGVATTGNASRGVSEPVSISPYCLAVAPGNESEEELLARMGNGIYITELKGLHAGASAVTGDFSIESAGFLVENGKKTRAVKGFTVAGNFYDLLKSVAGVSDRAEMGFPGFFATAAPAVFCKGLSVACE